MRIQISRFFYKIFSESVYLFRKAEMKCIWEKAMLCSSSGEKWGHLRIPSPEYTSISSELSYKD